ncbi:hypothetical protein O0L34_g12059 [Tuta absoluta]|nr:hypothetical protein O0L34_g12059 [Tuta absoluta]
MKKSTDKSKPKEKIKQEIPTPRKKTEKEDEIKKSVTPRNFLQKSSTLDIYGQKKKTAPVTAKTPRKVAGITHTSNVTPSKDFLKSSPSSISQLSAKSAYDKTPKVSAQKRLDLKAESNTSINSARKVRTARDLPFSNVTVSSPVAKRKLNPVVESNNKKATITTTKNIETKASVPKRTDTKTVSSKALDRGDSEDIGDRQRTKTRTLDKNEVKVLTPDGVDNNTEMKNLTKRLSAKPKAFYVELEEGNTKITELTSDNDVSYEDDFESYESDFDSYHSDRSAESSNDNGHSQNDDHNDSSEHEQNNSQSSNENVCDDHTENSYLKEGKDEEKMLDSGNFDLRDRSAKSRPAAMDFILEDAEDDKKVSLTDEGFQDMSSSSAVSNVKSHVDVLDRPLFIDFTKSKECKRKRKLNERLKQRASDLLTMITLHEMSYNLFEMKPIPYDLYMATFGRSNYTQVAVQTFDDGITEEVQTEEISVDHKWTQHPIEFSKSDVYLYPEDISKKYGKEKEDYLAKFTFLINKDISANNKNNFDKSYKDHPLRIYFEQKDGAGSCKMLPYENYKKKVEDNDFNATKLSKFLKKVERRISNVLSLNSDKNLIQFKNSLNQKIPLSKGYLTIAPKSVNNEKFSFIKNSTISNIIFSETKNNLIMLVHSKTSNNVGDRCVICLWDISVAMQAPIKILVAIDNVTIGRFKGSSDGILVAALNDGTLHLWDLSEEPTWRNDVASDTKTTDLVEINTYGMTATEKEREWNAKNAGNVRIHQPTLAHALQACAFTNSAANMTNTDVIDDVVGLEFVGDAPSSGVEGGRKIVGRVCTLQRVGILSFWTIIQEKTKTSDIGKAYWSKMKLEKTQTIKLLDHIDLPEKILNNEDVITNFTLNAAKRRLTKRKSEKNVLRKDKTRPKSTSSSEFDISRPASAASFKRVLSVEKKVHESWENGIVCSDLKILRLEKTENYLVGKNCGEVLCCTKTAGSFKVEKLCIANDMSSITCLGVSFHDIPYFLAATDSGTVNLCSLTESRVLLTLDCRNGPPSEGQEKCQSDNKGRFVSSAKVHPPATFDAKMDSKMPVTFLHWSPTNPCSMYTLLRNGSLSMWDLTCSDIYAKSVATQAAVGCAAGDGLLVAQKATFTVVRGSIVKEIRQRFTDWITQVIRLYRGEEFVEFEWVIGPVPIGTDLGKEVVSIFSSNITSGGQFYTDSNGRQMMRRTCWNETAAQQHKKPVPACYYPVVSRICLHSTNGTVGLCVLTDRAQGGTSYKEGELELMVHRRLLTDDGFGLEEPLNEAAFGVGLVVKGKHRVFFGNLKQEVEDLTFSERVAAAARRWQMEPWLFMTAADKINRRKWQNVRNKRYSALRLHGLPRHIHVLTLEPWKGGSVLLRLENTLEKSTRGLLKNQKADGPEDFVNKPSHITVQLQKLFIHLKIKRVRETTLAANQWLDDARQMDWSTRYVYQGADDDILPEDNVEGDDSKPGKDRHDEEKDDKDPANYSSEERNNRRKTKSKRTLRNIPKSHHERNYRRRRSTNVTVNVLENSINATFNTKYDENDNNTIEDQDFGTASTLSLKMMSIDNIDTTSNVTILPDISVPTYAISRFKNIGKDHLVTRKPKKFYSLKQNRPTFSDGKKLVDVVSSEEDFSVNIKESLKRRNKNKSAKEYIFKDLELPNVDGPDDGITRSMYEMYYKSQANIKSLDNKKPRALKSLAVKDVRERKAAVEGNGRRKGRKRKMRKYKNYDEDYTDGGRSHDTRQESHRMDYEDIVIPEAGEEMESEEVGRRRSKVSRLLLFSRQESHRMDNNDIVIIEAGDEIDSEEVGRRRTKVSRLLLFSRQESHKVDNIDIVITESGDEMDSVEVSSRRSKVSRLLLFS